ncbi:helix-turn-helix domain-containing protein [Pseudoalteromonas rubra]
MATNRNRLSRVFKSYYGATVFNWLRELRMQRAAELLCSTDNSIQEIAFSVGYSDSNNFSTAFKRCFQTSPIQFRKQAVVSSRVQ